MISLTSRITLSVAVVFISSAAALAIPVVNTASSAGAFPVSAVDVLNGLTGVVTGTALGGQEGTSSNVNILTNGAFGIAGNPLHLAETVSIGNNTTITYNFNLTNANQGFTITEVDVFSGWRDSGRDRQDYSVLYSTIAAPGVFIPVATVAGFNPSPSPSGASFITDTTGTLATGVASLRFVFGNQENGFVGYRELDAIGFGVHIPEPATLTTLCLGSLVLLRRRRAA